MKLFLTLFPVTLCLWAWLAIDCLRYKWASRYVQSEVRLLSIFEFFRTPVWAVKTRAFVGVALLALVPYVNLLMLFAMISFLTGFLIFRICYRR